MCVVQLFAYWPGWLRIHAGARESPPPPFLPSRWPSSPSCHRVNKQQMLNPNDSTLIYGMVWYNLFVIYWRKEITIKEKYPEGRPLASEWSFSSVSEGRVR